MPVRILFFGALREKAGDVARDVNLPGNVTTLAGLIDWLAADNETLSIALAAPSLRIAVDQRMIRERDENISHAREIAFMPPFSGG